ncbi:MAG: hypothetical protein ACXVEE_43800, partial [Polyangiales bacterium]
PAPAPVATAAPAATPTPATTVVGAPTTASVDPLPPQPAVQEPPAATGNVSPVSNNLTAGVPPSLHPGAPPAYWIWREANGWWHIRTTSIKGSVHRFWGAVAPQGASVGEVKPSRLEFNDRIKFSQKHIYWTFDTSGHTDGFDFKTSGGGQCVRFNLQGTSTTQVFIGAKQVSPPTHHFELCP